MILQKSLSDKRQNGVKKGSNSSTFHHFSSADGHLKPSFFLLENHIFNKQINHYHNVNLFEKP